MSINCNKIDNTNSNHNWILIFNFLSHLDSAIYLFVAPILAPIFFPDNDLFIQLVYVYSIQITSVLAKPLGTGFFGLIAFYRDPIIGLSLAMFGVGIAGLLLAILPITSAIGSLSTIILIILRILSGICTSGANSIAKTYLIENSIEIASYRSIYNYNISTILAGIVSFMLVYGNKLFNCGFNLNWRISFGVIGTMVILLGIMVIPMVPKQRLKYKQWLVGVTLPKQRLGSEQLSVGVMLPEQRLKSKQFMAENVLPSSKFLSQHNIFRELWRYKLKVLIIALLSGCAYLSYLVPIVLFSTFIPLISTISDKIVLKINLFLLIVDLLILLFFSYRFTGYKSRQTLLLSSIILALSILPIFYYLPQASILTLTLSGCWIILLGIIFDVQANLWCYSLVAHLPNRYFLLSLSSGLGAGLIGKSIISICWYLWYKYQDVAAPAIYLTGLMLVASIMILLEITSNRAITQQA